MIDETDVVTYRSDDCANESQTWLAQVVLANGKFWGVYFTGYTQEQVIKDAIAFWNAEEAKIKERLPTGSGQVFDGQKTDIRGHHLAGKVWMIHSTTREKVRVDPDKVAEYEFKGYERGGPRSK